MNRVPYDTVYSVQLKRQYVSILRCLIMIINTKNLYSCTMMDRFNRHSSFVYRCVFQKVMLFTHSYRSGTLHYSRDHNADVGVTRKCLQ